MILRPILLALLAALLLAVPVAHADDYEMLFLDRHGALPTSKRLHAKVLGTSAGERHGGYGYVRIYVRNPDTKVHQVTFVITPSYSWRASGDVATQSVRRSLRLEPGERATLNLPLANTRGGATLRAVVDGRGVRDQVDLGSSTRRGTGRASILAVWGQDVGRTLKWTSFFETRAPRSSGGDPELEIVSRAAPDLPDRWVLISGFDLAVVDIETPDLSAEHERMLAQYVAGGGALVLRGQPTEGPLAAMIERGAESTDATSGFHGLGRWYVLSTDVFPASLQRWLAAGTRTGEYGILQSASRRYSGSLPTPLWLPLAIPGLGEVPVKAFFFLILAFAVVVGPLNYFYCRRKRNLALLLVTIPATGFLCTLVILLYGFFSEGFGVSGGVRSFSVLDQRDHRAATCTGQTLYAGLQPAVLVPQAGSFFCSSGFRLEGGDPGAAALFRVDLDDGYRVEGSALPSRTPMPSISVSVGPARARLRFRRRPEGAFDVLAGPGFEPVEEAAAVLLRTFDGAYYLMDAAGTLKPQSAQGHAEALLIEQVVRSLNAMPLGSGELLDEDDYWGYSRQYRNRQAMEGIARGTEGLERWLAWRLPTLRKGSYLARMKQPPHQETLGLDIDYRTSEHLVVGLLAEEDVLDE